LIQTDAAVQVMAGSDRRAQLFADPVRRDGRIGTRIESFGQPPARRPGGQMQSPRRDIDVGDLLRHGLQGGERTVELAAGGDVFSGQGQRPGQQAVRGQRGCHDRNLVQVTDGLPIAAATDQIGDRHDHLVQGEMMVRFMTSQRDGREADSWGARVDDQQPGAGVRDRDRNQHAVRAIGVRDGDFGSGDDEVVTLPAGSGAWADRERFRLLVQCRGEHQALLHHPWQERFLLLAGTTAGQRKRPERQRRQHRSGHRPTTHFGQDDGSPGQAQAITAAVLRQCQTEQTAVHDGSPALGHGLLLRSVQDVSRQRGDLSLGLIQLEIHRFPLSQPAHGAGPEAAPPPASAGSGWFHRQWKGIG
jgi:hypothetical protein